jgi:hypothetical protein
VASGNILDVFQDGQKRGAQKALEFGKDAVKEVAIAQSASHIDAQSRDRV